MKKILILGAGFGGLRAAKQIAKKIKRLKLDEKYEVVLIDKNGHHTYTPLLYEAATTSKNKAGVRELHEVAAYGVRALIKNLPIKFIQGEVAGLDLRQGHVHVKSGVAAEQKLTCDYAVLALGSETNYFGIKGLEKNSISLKEFSDAVKIRDRIWDLAAEKRGRIKILVGGGGSTGVEFAGELKAWCGETAKEFPGCVLEVEIIEAAPTVLPGFPEKIIRLAATRLKKLGVKITTGGKITEARESEIVFDGTGKTPFDVLVWAGGVKAPPLLTRMPLEIEKRGRAVVGEKMDVCIPEDPHLHVRPRVYGIGDSICFYNPTTGQPVPGVARAAIIQADVAAHNLVADVVREANMTRKPYTTYKTYKPRDYPYIIPVGGKWAIAKIGPFVISGFFGWVFKGLVELNYLLSIMPFWRAVRTWLKGLWIFIKNDRLG